MYKVLFLILFINHAHGFRLNTNIGAGFGSRKVSISVTSNSTCTNAGISKEELLNIAMDGAKKYWNKVATADIEVTNGGIYQTSDSKFLTEKLCAEDDTTACDSSTSVPVVSNIVIACNNNTTDNFPNSQYLALTAPVKISGRNIKGSVILINDSASTSFASLSTAEKESVLAHEIGHALGLGHSNKDHALMYYLNSSKMERLSQDDIDGLTYLYPTAIENCSPLFGGIIDKKDPPSFNTNFPKAFMIGLSVCFFILFFYKLFTQSIKIPRPLDPN